MAALKGNDKSPDYTSVPKEPRLGVIVEGFKLVQKYERFNVWQRHSKTIRPYKTCFPKKTVPNRNAIKTIV